MTKAQHKAAGREASIAASKARRVRKPEPAFVSVIAHQPDDRPRMILTSRSWVEVPPTVERTSRRTAKPSYMDTVTGRFDNSPEAMNARHSIR